MMLAIAITTVAAMVTITNIRSNNAYSGGEQALANAESGAENALQRLLRDPGYTGESLTLPNGAATISVTGTMTKTITSVGSIDNARIAFGGGVTAIEGGFDSFNPIEIIQAQVRVTNSVIENNANGLSLTGRNGRGFNTAAAIFVRGAQPVIVDNIIQNDKGDAISIDANSLNAINIPDWGLSRGTSNAFNQFADNDGPLVQVRS